MLGSKYRDTLLEYLNDEDIPDFLGGKSQGDIADDIGPWNAYELDSNGLLMLKGEDKADDAEEKKVDDDGAKKVDEEEEKKDDDDGA